MEKLDKKKTQLVVKAKDRVEQYILTHGFHTCIGISTFFFICIPKVWAKLWEL